MQCLFWWKLNILGLEFWDHSFWKNLEIRCILMRYQLISVANETNHCWFQIDVEGMLLLCYQIYLQSFETSCKSHFWRSFSLLFLSTFSNKIYFLTSNLWNFTKPFFDGLNASTILIGDSEQSLQESEMHSNWRKPLSAASDVQPWEQLWVIESSFVLFSFSKLLRSLYCNLMLR